MNTEEEDREAEEAAFSQSANERSATPRLEDEEEGGCDTHTYTHTHTRTRARARAAAAGANTASSAFGCTKARGRR